MNKSQIKSDTRLLFYDHNLLIEINGESVITQCKLRSCDFYWLIDFLVFNATFSNISAISWRPVLVVEEAGVPEENHRPWASNW